MRCWAPEIWSSTCLLYTSESRFAVERRDRTIHSRMREYLYTLKHHKNLETSILPLGDGVALSVKKNEERR